MRSNPPRNKRRGGDCLTGRDRRRVGHEDMLPGVEMALSAMTAHAVLQQAGYRLNPF